MLTYLIIMGQLTKYQKISWKYNHIFISVYKTILVHILFLDHEISYILAV